MNTSAASENIIDWSVKSARMLFGMWSMNMQNRARPRKKSSRRSRSVADGLVAMVMISSESLLSTATSAGLFRRMTTPRSC